MRRRYVYRPGTDRLPDDVVRRLRGLLAVVMRPPERCQDPIRRDDELLDRL